jgi:outer membrane protein OmpA-like peptidoglycan-associated protein
MTRAAPDLYFDVNSHVLQVRERRKLEQIAPAVQDILHDFPELIILIEGHSDDRGLHEYNQQLGLERADAVRRVFLNLSFPEDRVRAVSFGDRAPQCLTPDEACRQKNRRVHFRAAQPMSGVPGED